MLGRKNILIHLLSLCVLGIGFVLCRYVFLDVHSMKQWPEVLFGVGLVAVVLSFLLQGKTTPIFTALAYILGFAAGVIFQTDGVDAGGARTNDLWIIWTGVFLCLIVVGIIGERIIGIHKKPTE